MSADQLNLVTRNKRLIFDAESFVQFNTGQVQAARSKVEESLSEVMQAYVLVATCNRELCMRSVEDVYRNRIMMLENLKTETPEQQVFQRSMINRSRLLMLENRARINREMLKSLENMLDVVRQFKSTTQSFDEICDDLVNHVDSVNDENAQWLDGELLGHMHAATTLTNETRVNENYDRVRHLRNNAYENRKMIQTLVNLCKEVRNDIESLQEDPHDQQEQLMNMREKIDANQKRIADDLFKL